MPLTNFPNGISSFGVPLPNAGIPFMMGHNKYFFVDCEFGSDDYNGESPEQAFGTIARANTVMRARVDWALSPWAVRDVCIIAPGTYAEELTSLAHGVVYYGLGWDNRDAQMGVKIKPASGIPVDVGGVVNSAFHNIGFETVETGASAKIFDSTITNNCLFKNCWFSGPAETATAVGFYASDCTRTKWIDCEFTCCDIGMDIEYVDGGDKFAHCLLDGCNFMQCDTAGLKISTNLVGPSSIVNRCNFHGAGQTMVYAIYDLSAILDVAWCCAEASSHYSGCRSVNGSYSEGGLKT